MSSKDLRDNIANTAKSGFGKAKEISGRVSDKAKELQPKLNQAVDQTKSTFQTQSERMNDNSHIKNFQEHVSPRFKKANLDVVKPRLRKAKDSIDSMSGKRLEEKLAEYTDVFSEVLLGLYQRAEEDRSEYKLKLQQMASEIESLKATVQSIQQGNSQAGGEK